MKRSIILCFMLVAVFAAACDILPENGGEIRIKARTVSPFTKTTYGQISGNVQAIEWEENDLIKIYSPELVRPEGNYDIHYAKYVLSNIQTEGAISSAGTVSLAGENPNGLNWSETNQAPATFYAIYPATMFCHRNSANQDIYNQFDLVFPSAQDMVWGGDNNRVGAPVMNYAYLVAKNTIAYGEQVSLDFTPAFNAFEVHLKCDEGMDDVELLSASLICGSADEAGYLAGVGVYDLDAATPGLVDYGSEVAYPNDNKVTVDLSDKIIGVNKEVVFTFLTLPKDLTKMSLVLTYKGSGGTETTRTLALNYSNGDPVPFSAGTKAILRGVALKEGWNFILQTDLVVMGWTVGSETTIEFGDRNTVSVPEPFNFSTQETGYDNTNVDIDEETWAITFNNVSNSVFHLTFTIAAPSGANWSVQKEDPNNYFTLVALNEDGTERAPSGTVDNNKIVLRLRPNSSTIPSSRTSDYTMVLHTFIEIGDNAYNIDSETQIYDQYHSLATFTIPANN